MQEAHGIQSGHRIDEPMLPWNDEREMDLWGLPTEDVTPRMVLDHRNKRLDYQYDDQRVSDSDIHGDLVALAELSRRIAADALERAGRWMRRPNRFGVGALVGRGSFGLLWQCPHAFEGLLEWEPAPHGEPVN